MKRLLTLTAILEAGAGIGLLAAPSGIVHLLLGAALDAPASVTVARIAGAALLALGGACWFASFDVRSCAARGVVSAMVLYNFAATVILGVAGLGSPPAGIALWPAVILHGAMGVWCAIMLLKKPPALPAPLTRDSSSVG